MKKIGLFLNSEPTCGGVHTYNQLILEAALASNFTLVVFTCSRYWKEYLKDVEVECYWTKENFLWRALAKIWRVFNLPLCIYRFMAKFFHPIARKMQKTNCKVWIFPSQDALTYLLPVPSVGVIHDLMHRYESTFPEVGSEQSIKIRDYQFQNICNYAKRIFVDSNVGRDHVCESYQIPPEKCWVLPYATLERKANILPKNELLTKYNLPDKFLFYPAQFWEHKNHRKLIEAIALLKNNVDNIFLVLVGSKKNAYEFVLQRIQELNLASNVYMLGFVPDQDMPSFYKHAYALVMPTFFGPTNIPPLEAIQYDCPVIVSGIYGMKEQLQEAAMYIDPNSTESIVKAIELIWDQTGLREKLIDNGRILKKTWNQQSFNRKFNYFINAAFEFKELETVVDNFSLK